MLFLLREKHFDLCTLSQHAVKLDFSVVKLSCMLDNGKSQSCAANLFGMAFIYTEKPFKYALLLFFRNSDTRIGYSKY